MQILVGVAKVDITPPPGVVLAGYGPRRGADGPVGHPLRAEALVCRCGDAAWALVTSDTIGYPHDFVARLRTGIAARTNLAPDAIAVSATHTHSGPAAMRTYHTELAELDHAYRTELQQRLEEVVVQADRDVEPGVFEVAWTEAPELAHNRRVIDDQGVCRNEWEDSDGSHTGFFDPTVMLVGLRRADGHRAALLVNYGCHPVTLGPRSLAISADYVGYMKDYLEETGTAKMAMFALAGAGNINPRTCIRVGAEFPETMGRALGEIVRAAAPQLKAVPDGPVASRRQPWRFTARHDGPANTGRKKGDVIETEVAAFRAGGLAFVTVPCELFSDYVPRFREASPVEATVVLSLTSDSVGYLPIDEAQHQGGLEARRAAGEDLEKPVLRHVRQALEGIS